MIGGGELAGIYGLLMQIVGRRTPEIGIRMALGAQSGPVLRLILWQGLLPVLIGVLGGLGCAIAGARLVATQLYGITHTDPLTYAAGVLGLLGAALLAMAYPAWRASRVDPMTALRHE